MARELPVAFQLVTKSMPELPEVETVRRIIDREVSGRTIIGASFRDFPGVTGATDPATFDALISGRVISEPERYGKYLVLPLDNELALLIHLRMTGRLLVLPAAAPPARFEHLAIHLDTGHDLRFADQRKFGRVLILPANAAREQMSNLLGPEPLGRDFTAAYLADRLRGRTTSIKAFLLDQRNVAGLGNIYVDEALYLARLHPLTPAGSLAPDRVGPLARAVRRVLRTAIANQGTTFSTFENPYGERGSNAEALAVYGKGKTGMPCPRCRTPFTWIRVAGRGTSFCPRCQPLNAIDQSLAE